jgi:hypothetical protein
MIDTATETLIQTPTPATTTAPAPDAPAAVAAPEAIPGLGDVLTEDAAPADEPAAEEAKEDAEQKGPPETYALEAPEGFEITAEAVAIAEPVFKELGLTNEQANKLMPVAAQFAEQVASGILAKGEALKAEWAREALADPELGGGDPAIYKQNLGIAAKSIETFGTPALRQVLNESGLGNHPEVIRYALKTGQKISDEGHGYRNEGATPTKADRLALLYPNNLPPT